MPQDWFRSADWTPEAQAEFEVRLSRARAYNRPQYLRAKAIALREHGGSDRRRGARELNERVIRDYPDSFFDLVVAHEQLALLAEDDGQLEQAIHHYRDALYLSEEGAPSGDAILRLPELLISEQPDLERLREAATVVGRINPERDLAFSSQRFRYNALRARLAEQDGDSTRAASFATAALAEWHRSAPVHTASEPRLGSEHTRNTRAIGTARRIRLTAARASFRNTGACDWEGYGSQPSRYAERSSGPKLA